MSVPVSAWAVNTDETYCTDPASVTVNSGPRVGGVQCQANDAGTIYFNLPIIQAPAGNELTVAVYAVATSVSPSGALAADVSAFCENDSGLVAHDYGSEETLDVTFDTRYDLETATSAGVTPAGTCQTGSMLFVRYQIDAGGTTGSIESEILDFLLAY